jgi:hypothetical protein
LKKKRAIFLNFSGQHDLPQNIVTADGSSSMTQNQNASLQWKMSMKSKIHVKGIISYESVSTKQQSLKYSAFRF